MINAGGWEEIIKLYDLMGDEGEEDWFERGVLQAIGYKEFLKYYQSEDRNETVLEECMKLLDLHSV